MSVHLLERLMIPQLTSIMHHSLNYSRTNMKSHNNSRTDARRRILLSHIQYRCVCLWDWSITHKNTLASHPHSHWPVTHIHIGQSPTFTLVSHPHSHWSVTHIHIGQSPTFSHPETYYIQVYTTC